MTEQQKAKWLELTAAGWVHLGYDVSGTYPRFERGDKPERVWVAKDGTVMPEDGGTEAGLHTHGYERNPGRGY